ncbi:MAG: DUF72 domain-containing protein [Acidobacteriota bacterium]
MGEQLDLFGGEWKGARDDGDAGRRLEIEHADAARIAAAIPELVRFGTSSWSFPGWTGIVWSRARTQSEAARDGLVEYARHPLLRTVGIDRGFYAPIPEEELHRYADQLPPGFPCCAKVPEAITSPVRVGAGRPIKNETFLDAAALLRDTLEPFARAFSDHIGPFLLQFPPVPGKLRLAPDRFAERLDAFLERLPPEHSYAVELRDPTLLTPAYAEVLARHRVAHVYNQATAMPRIGVQRSRVPLATVPFAVVRLLLRPGSRYAERRDAFMPFDRIVDPDPLMRREVVDLLVDAIGTSKPSYVLVNNKAEGCAPLTVKALAELLAGRGETPVAERDAGPPAPAR